MKNNLIKYFYKIAKENDTLVIYKLPFDKKSLTPVLSPESFDIHFGKLAKGYAERYNNGIGDKEFNEAGVYLHNIFFSQLKEPKNSNKPTGQSLDLIEKKYKTYENFKDEFKNIAMSIQGSGWIYFSKSGDIKIIKNHQIKKDMANALQP